MAGGSPCRKAQGTVILVDFEPSPFFGGPATPFRQGVTDPGTPGDRLQQSQPETEAVELIHRQRRRVDLLSRTEQPLFIQVPQIPAQT